MGYFMFWVLLILFIIREAEESRRVDKAKGYTIEKYLIKRDFAKKLAEKLEIQADGGDSPAEFVRWAIQEAMKETRN